MKLILCEKCWDVFKLAREMRQCSCGAVKGRYKDNVMAEVSENAVSLAIGNGSLLQSVADMRTIQKNSNNLATRGDYYRDNQGKIEYAWVRPNSGPGNPHCKII